MEMRYGKYAYFEGQIVPIEQARVSIMTHAFNYGTAVFEGIRGYWSEAENQLYIFKMQEHYRRMFKNFSILKIEINKSIEEICAITLELARRDGFQEDMYIRPIGYKSSYEIGPKVHGLEDEFAIFNIALAEYVDTKAGLSVMVSSWRRVEDSAIPARGKITGSYVNSALASTEAAENGFDEAIVLNEDGHVSEGSAMNLFLVHDGELVTTPVSANILEGITRAIVIELARKELSLETVVREIDRTELYTCDEAFFCGTGAQVAPVTSVDRRPVGNGQPGEICLTLQELYFKVVHGQTDQYKEWCTPVYGE